MKYVSTRGQAPVRDFAGVLLAGLAEDGGLYVPQSWPEFSMADWRAMRGLSYSELVARVMAPFVGNAIPFATLQQLCRESYAGFSNPAVVPLVQLDSALWTQELFHGPTLAFKDLAMQLLGRLFDHVLTAGDTRVTIVGATSGDTGSAAIEACANRARVDVVILHPEGRTSEVQRRQMTTVLAPNIGNIAVDGSFDDCQDLVKAMFADAPFREEMRLSAVNSINWARIAAQIPYYVAAALALGAPEREVAFSVPTGNFGNVLAAWAARRMGLPIARLVVAPTATTSSRASSLATTCRCAASSRVCRRAWTSRSARISSASCSNCSTAIPRSTAAAMTDVPLDRTDAGSGECVEARHRQCFTASGSTMRGPSRRSGECYSECGYLADPHTAIGVAAARASACAHGVPTIAAGTAHPAKFPDAMEQATGIRPPLPPRLADLYDRPEKFTRAPNDLAAIEAGVRATVLRNAA